MMHRDIKKRLKDMHEDDINPVSWMLEVAPECVELSVPECEPCMGVVRHKNAKRHHAWIDSLEWGGYKVETVELSRAINSDRWVVRKRNVPFAGYDYYGHHVIGYKNSKEERTYALRVIK